jgi:hypothetical protein
MQFLTPDMIARIADVLGIDRDKTQSAVGAAVPGLLAGFSSVASQPAGAQKLADAAQQQSGVLGSFSSLIGTGSQTSLIDRGSQMLSSLLGSRDEGALATAIGTFTGVGRTAGTSLIGMLAPLVMGTLAQQGSRDPDGRGIAGLLASQRDNIAAAMPSGFGSLLSGTNLLSSLGGAARAATAAGTETARAAASAAYGVGDASRRAAGAAASASYKWLYWAVPLLILVALIVFLLGRPTQQTVSTPPSLVVGGVDIGKQMSDSLSDLRATLAGITSPATAQSALPKLKDISAQIDRIAGLKGQLTDAQQAALAGLVKPVMPAFNDLSAKVLAIPGVADVAKPTIDALTTKLTALAS